MKNNKIKIMSSALSFIGLLNLSVGAFAQGSGTNASAGSALISEGALPRYLLVITCALFLIIIAVLANAIKIASKSYFAKIKDEKKNGGKATTLLVLLTLSSTELFAAGESAAPGGNAFANLDLYLIGTAVLILFIAVLALVRALFVLMGIRAPQAEAPAVAPVKVKTWFQRLNNTVAIEDEDQLDLQHDYDGIRELDNKVPNWWSWTFIASALFGVIYMYRMFGSENMPKQLEELSIEYAQAEVAKEAYLKKNANMVDENTVVMLSGADLVSGGGIYATNCLVCHGDKGQGGVGPNLTDDYWIHKGSIKDIFYAVKYGWQEKGMKAWQNDLSPMQMAQVSSYVKSLNGTQPPNPKEKQGELYVEETNNVSDTLKQVTQVPADSTKK